MQRIEGGQLTTARRVVLRAPPAQLSLDKPGRASELGEPDLARRDAVQLTEHARDLQAGRPQRLG
jgi:hypothetical protein